MELGRLNVARSPDHVLARAYNEALATLTPAMISFYNLPMAQMLEQLANNWDGVSLIDSPLQNLAMMQALMTGEATPATFGISNSTAAMLAATLGAASDKTLPISTDTVIALTTILEIPITAQAAADLAVRAEAVRQAILQGHG